MNLLFYLLLGVIFGFAIASIFAGRHEGDRPKRSLRFLIGREYIHIHHWIYCTLIVVLFFLIDIFHPILYGFLIGAALQGFTYRDWHYVFYKKSAYKKIYSKFK